MTAPQALEQLKQGNKRFLATGCYTHVADSPYLQHLALGQHPFAVVVTCADSRVAPEVLFDAALGQLFVVRVAGNVLCQSQLASIQYAVHHLGSALVVILGHTLCGAVSAAMQGQLDGPVGCLTRPIVSLIRGIADPTQAACANVRGQLDILRRAIGDECMAVGAIYDVATGRVEWL